MKVGGRSRSGWEGAGLLVLGIGILIALFLRSSSHEQGRATDPAVPLNDAPTDAAADAQLPGLGPAAAGNHTRHTIVQDADTEDMAATNARRILARSRAAYAECHTYEDDGTIDEDFRGKQKFLNQIVFHTVFAGPNAVRVAYRKLADRWGPDQVSQVVVNEAGAQSIDPWFKEPQNLRNLEFAVGAQAGVSHGLTVAILPLLPAGLPQGDTWLDVPRPELTDSEDIDGETCDVIETTLGGGRDHVRISIGRSDSLIHRISNDSVITAAALAEEDEAMREAGLDFATDDTDAEREDLSTFTVTTFHPRCGRPVSPDALRLTDGSI